MNAKVTYGEYEYLEKSNEWEIRCAPHVMLRAKRVFQKIFKGKFGKFRITATDENSCDLEWFLKRYPMVCAGLSTHSELTYRARTFDKLLVDTLDILGGKCKFTCGSNMALPPRDYQQQAAQLTLRTGGLLLADDLGLGKTVTAITVLTGPNTLPAIVVCPTHLTQQWKNEIDRFLPGLFVHILSKTKVYDLKNKGRNPDVIVTSYSKINGWASHLAGTIRTCIFDECQALRRSKSLKYSACSHLAAETPIKIGLSATPIYNYGNEFFNVLSVLHGDKIGTYEEFVREWCVKDYGDRGAIISDPKAFGTYLRANALMLRRTRKEVGRELPALSTIVHQIDSDPEALKKIEGSAMELARIILAQQGVTNFQKMRAASELDNAVRQATGIAKAPYVAEFVKILLENGESVVLYAWHHTVYDIFKDKLEDYNPAWYTGRQSAVKKNIEAERFKSGETKLMIISLRSGEGLDGLQHACKTVVVAELDWSPGVLEQCVGRVQRDGQKNPVFAYYLVAKDGSDPPMTDVLGLKKAQLDPVRDPDGKIVIEKTVDPNHIKKLAAAYLKKDSQ